MSAPDVRVSDAERQRVVSTLSTAVGEGRLTLAEADERIVSAWAARHGGELAALTADLPAPAPPVARPGRRPALFGLIALLVVIAWVLSPVPFFWPVFPLTFLAVRAVRTARPHPGPASA
ncbi:DUF1707 SHOCT-like domain-containing protein [Umezawaea beigongshangensis]|uniref:DUF1707 SHOCT-like domain-containing protein n=1 Tax=Umezawaea beigongshangensis TaxID=2780383 RepID=UPI0018F2405D|nr:DUF1707 domain-containing protein [Umezawaea beigongshangensis]